jgi:hypothetical protein
MTLNHLPLNYVRHSYIHIIPQQKHLLIELTHPLHKPLFLILKKGTAFTVPKTLGKRSSIQIFKPS